MVSRSLASQLQASLEDDYDLLCRNRRVTGTVKRLHCRRGRKDRAGRHGPQRTGSIDPVVQRAGSGSGTDRPGSGAAAAMRGAQLKAELIETRHVRTAFEIMPVKTDRKDARGIAQLMRLGWFRPVHCKTVAAQEMRAELTARKLMQINLHRTDMSLRGILRNFGLKVGKVSKGKFEARIRELVEGNPTLERVAEAMLCARRALAKELSWPASRSE